MKIQFNLLRLCLGGYLLFLNAFINGAMYVTVKIEIKGLKITVEMETESDVRSKTTVSGKNVDAIRDALFQTPNEGIKFKYDNQATNYGGLINSIADPLQLEEVKNAFAEFQDYVMQNIRGVVADKSAFNAKVDIASKSSLTAANKDVYKHVLALGKVLGIEMPDPDSGLFGSVCKVLSNRWVKRAIYAGLAVGGIALLYNKWGQWSNIIGTKTEQCGTGIETAGQGISTIGGSLQKGGRSIKETGTWIKTPPKAPAQMPTRGALVNATPQITPTPEIFENMPTSPSTPTP